MKIGISILARRGQNVWNNGLFQNIYHLATLFEAIPFVERVFLLNCGDAESHPAGAEEFAARFPLVNLHAANDLVDVAVEMGGGLDLEWIRRFRARGGKCVFHGCGQPYAALLEATIFDRQGFFGDPDRCDEIWLLPKDAQFTGMLATINRCAVRVVPYLWAPCFLEHTIGQVSDLPSRFGYQEGTLKIGSLKPAIFEPNLSPIKMGLIPMLICEELERSGAATVSQVDFMNGEHLLQQTSFVYFMQNLRLYEQGRVKIRGRDYFSHIMMRGANVVVSHQIDCAQNYLYLDALYGGYPLVHNSPLFADVGYYYEGADVADGVNALIRAVSTHDALLAEYKRAGEAKILALSPSGRENRDAYARQLVALADTRRSEGHMA